MWGDHWLYFSGEKIGEDTKTFFKRIVFIAGSFFTLIWLVANIWGALGCAAYLIRQKLPKFVDIGAALSLAALAFLIFVSVLIFPEPGKNAIVKFVYIMPMALLAVPKMQELVKKFVPSKYYLMYLSLVFVLCLPLYIYTK